MQRLNFKNLNRVAKPPIPVPIKRQLKSLNTEYNFKWNQPCLSPVSNLKSGSNSLNSASVQFFSHEPLNIP